MMAVSYQGGSATLAVRHNVAVLCNRAEIAADLWQRIGPDFGVEQVVALLLREHFTELRDIIVLEFAGQSVAGVVRGNAEVTLTGATGDPITISGREVRTWREFSLDRAAGIAARLDADTAGVSRQLESGVVAAGGFYWLHSVDIAGVSSVGTPSATGLAVPVTDQSGAHVDSVAVLPCAPGSDREVATPTTEQSVPTVQVPMPAPTLADTRIPGGDSDYGHLWDATVLRTAEQAAVRPVPAQIEPEQLTEELDRLGDHDGSTILGSQLAALRERHRQPPLPPTSIPEHQLRFSDGQVVAVNRVVIAGRKPSAERFTGTEYPIMVTITGPQNDISRSHIEFRPASQGLQVTDLGSTNGSRLVPANGPVVELLPHTAALARPGDVIDLGDGVTITVEVS